MAKPMKIEGLDKLADLTREEVPPVPKLRPAPKVEPTTESAKPAVKRAKPALDEAEHTTVAIERRVRIRTTPNRRTYAGEPLRGPVEPGLPKLFSHVARELNRSDGNALEEAVLNWIELVLPAIADADDRANYQSRLARVRAAKEARKTADVR